MAKHRKRYLTSYIIITDTQTKTIRYFFHLAKMIPRCLEKQHYHSLGSINLYNPYEKQFGNINEVTTIKGQWINTFWYSRTIITKIHNENLVWLSKRWRQIQIWGPRKMANKHVKKKLLWSVKKKHKKTWYTMFIYIYEWMCLEVNLTKHMVKVIN